jgi:importin subunit beta-1
MLTLIRPDGDNQLRMAAYEVLNTFVTNAAGDSLPIVAKLSDIILQRLENTLAMQQQVVSVEDKITLEEVQTSLASAVLVSPSLFTSLLASNCGTGYHSTTRGRN